jgi:DNA primase
MSRFVDFKAVKAAVSMLQVLEHYGLAASFKRSGNSLSGPCPLHGGENRTQFRVSLEKNCWNCFGTCKGGGNVLDFVARKEGCSLREAALALCDWFELPTQEKPARPAKDAGEPPTSSAPPKAEPRPKAAKAKESKPDEDGPNEPLGFALQNLDAAHPYLTERGLSAETIAEFGLGYCQKGSMTGRIVIPIFTSLPLVRAAARFPPARAAQYLPLSRRGKPAPHRAPAAPHSIPAPRGRRICPARLRRNHIPGAGRVRV